MIDVSIIVPVYNSEKYLCECADSIVGQTAKNTEIIFVDDGSQDNSMKILREYEKRDARVKIFQNSHSGGGAARNTGLENAHGEYVMFFDSDDLMEPEFVEKMYKKCKGTDSDIAVCSVRFWHESTGGVTDEVCGLRTENLPKKEVFCWKDMPEYIFNTFHNWPWNKIFKRSFIEKNGLRFQEIMRTNDLYFTCRALMLADRITCVNEYLVKYRVRLSGSCQASNSKAPLDFYKAFAALKDFLQENGFYEDVKQSFVNHALDGCIANLNTADFNQSQKLIFNALKDEIFESLDILGHNDEYFYKQNVDNKNLERLHYVLSGDYENFLLYRANELNNLYRERLCISYKDEQKIRSLRKQNKEYKIRLAKTQSELSISKIKLHISDGSMPERCMRTAKNLVKEIINTIRGL
ncbi:MAG: glycosyltransferase family 2 protein [Oscillospiraceae bacterium]